jgi:hypothetical protein
MKTQAIIIRTMIDDHIVELTSNKAVDPDVFCMVYRDKYHASLNHLNQEGCLYDDDMVNLYVSESTIDKIWDWALKNGY